jgi:hypothetical protein
VFNGGFELPVTNQGFDWRLPNIKGAVRSTQDETYGVSGERALHLVFEGREFRFNHLYQQLFLNVGTYRFTVRTRTDSLEGRGGLMWSIACAATPAELLGETDRLLGTNEWRWLTMEFAIPDATCDSQVLRLQSTGDRLYDHKLEGHAWFDRVQILKEADNVDKNPPTAGPIGR